MEDFPVSGDAAIRIKYNAHRTGTVDVTDSELRVIRFNRSRSDNDRVDDSAKSMQPDPVLWSSDVVGVAAFSCDASVDALADLADYEV